MQLSIVIVLLALVAMTTANRSCMTGQYTRNTGEGWTDYETCEEGVYVCNRMSYFKGDYHYTTWGCGQCSSDDNMYDVTCHECEYNYCNQGEDGEDTSGVGQLGVPAVAILIPAIFLQ